MPSAAAPAHLTAGDPFQERNPADIAVKSGTTVTAALYDPGKEPTMPGIARHLQPARTARSTLTYHIK